MLNIEAFKTCIRDNLKQRSFGKERADEIIKEFELRTKQHINFGRSETDASLFAMRETFDNLSRVAEEKAKRTAKMLSTQADNNARIAQGLTVDLKVLDAGRAKGDKKTSRGVALARAAVSLIENDPRFSGLSYSGRKEILRGEFFSLLSGALEHFEKGAFGRQKGKAHLPNVVREVFGEHTGDASAKELADAWLKVSDLTVDRFNAAGGTMNRLARYLPQKINPAKLVGLGEQNFIKLFGDAVDWSKTRRPDGTIVPVEDRAKLLADAYLTFSTDGASKIDPAAFRGQGVAIGNMIDNHRFFHFKDAGSWLKVHEALGDGTVFDVLVQHIEGMAHKIALVETFGPNPEATVRNVEAIVKKHAANLSAKDKADADGVLKNTFRPMMDVTLRSNPMDPNSKMGAAVTSTANVLTAAQLGSASLLAIPGDFMQTLAVRAINGMDLFGGIGTYFKTIAGDKAFQRQISAQSGFVIDEAVSATYATTRFSGLASIGPAVSRRIADSIMRLSLMSGHTAAARWTAQSEFMGLLHRMRDVDFEDLPFNHVMSRYGISKDDWDFVRKNVAPWSPRPDVTFMRPIDILQSGASNRYQLFQKFQGMILEEARKMVPESTIEASVTLRDTTRPDTLAGLLLHSFSMYKNFPVSFYMIYGRLGMTSPSVKGRLGFYAGLGAGMTMVGALGTQMREVAQGRDPLPMDTPAFWGKALLSGGAMSIWGDFLFGGVNKLGAGPTETAAGPVIGFVGDTANLAFGDIFKWAETVGTLNEDFESKFPAKLVEYFRRYTPGTNVWWARLALEREVWDRLQELADPKAYQKKLRKVRNQKSTYGNDYWWSPLDEAPTRLPQYTGSE